MLVGLFVGNGLSIERVGHQIGGGGGGGGHCCCQWLSVGGSLGIRGAVRDIGGTRCRCQWLIVGMVVQTWSRVR